MVMQGDTRNALKTAAPGAPCPDPPLLQRMLAHSPMRQLPEAVRSEWLSGCATWQVPSGQVVAQQGTVPDVCFGLLQGALELGLQDDSGEERVLDLLEPAQWVGAEALLLNAALPWRVRTFAPCVLLVMRRSVLRDLQARHAAVASALLEMSWRLSVRLTERNFVRADLPLSLKVRQLLDAFAQRFGVPEGGWTRIDVELTQTYLARLLGCSRQRANEQLRRLRAAGELRVVHRSYAIQRRD
jgi:CRP-like cAMP-binding protein